jgi:hypothetical protein
MPVAERPASIPSPWSWQTLASRTSTPRSTPSLRRGVLRRVLGLHGAQVFQLHDRGVVALPQDRMKRLVPFVKW